MKSQDPSQTSKREGGSRFDLRIERLGPLPIVNHFLQRLGLEKTLDTFVPTCDKRIAVSHAKCLGVLLRSIIVEREPVYRQQETVQSFAPGMFGLEAEEIDKIGDDRLGRALDQLFDADRAGLLTELVVAMSREFKLRFTKLHNDSTTIRFTGQYRKARGRSLRGKRAPWITYGFSKDHRPDLKQLLFILTTTGDGGVPVQFRCGDGNTNDSRTHIETWETLRKVAGKTDFLYVADSKLCSRDNMDYINHRGGRFVTVIPRSRGEDTVFRKWIQSNQPPWELVWDRPNPHKHRGPRDRWWVHRPKLPSRESWPITWVYSSLLALRQEQTRWEHIAKAMEKLQDLKQRLANPRSRIRRSAEVQVRIDEILSTYQVTGYLRVRKTAHQEHSYQQQTPGRPGPNTSFRRVTHRRFDIDWEIDEETIAYDRKSDGMYPLLTNDRSLTPAQVLQAHKGQPTIEKRFKQCKSVHEIAPVLLKNEGRIEALFFIYFIGLMVQALIERELRSEMKRQRIKELPIYPEERMSASPTTEQILRLFSLAQRHILLKKGKFVQLFQPQLTDLQHEVLALLDVPSYSFGWRG
jgi:transposase